MHSNGFTIQKVKPSDREEVLRLMVDVFYKDDPSSKYSLVSEKKIVCPILQEMTLEPLNEDLSFLVKVRDDKIVGTIINSVRPIILQPDYMDDYLKSVTCEREKTLLQFWKFMSLMPPQPDKIFGNEKHIFELRYMAVDKRFSRRGIANSLVNCSRREATEKGFKLIRMECTSHYSARIASSIGLKCIFSMNYEDYKNPEGVKVFTNVTPPHLKFKVFVG